MITEDESAEHCNALGEKTGFCEQYVAHHTE